MTSGISGYYQDTISNANGKPGWDSGWRSNLIVQNCDILLAALMKRQQGMQGILYLAIGEGKESWDTTPEDPSSAATTLFAELIRFELSADQIAYVDGAPGPGNTLEITVPIAGSDVITDTTQPLREFGLFGGNATAQTDTGYMIDYVIHSRIDLTAEVTLIRRIQLHFQNAGGEALWEPTVVVRESALGNLTIEHLDGVGSAYATQLSDAGIATIQDLATAEAATISVELPAMKLVELQAKARLLLRTASQITPVSGLFDCSAWDVIATPTQELIAQSGAPANAVEQLKDQVCNLQLTLDNRFLQETKLKDLTQSYPPD